MTDKLEVLKKIEQVGVVAVVRVDSTKSLLKVFDALEQGGVTAVEVTMTTPKAIDVIANAVEHYAGQVIIGVGTVLDAETARAAILAGAEFVVGPTLNPKVIEMARRYNKMVVPAGFTSTEILHAWELGADIVKVFPTSSVGPAYIKDVKGPLPQIKLMPTGGVRVDNAADFIKAGASVLAVGGNLVSKKAVAEGDFEFIRDAAQRFVEEVKKARAQSF